MRNLLELVSHVLIVCITKFYIASGGSGFLV